MAASRHTRSPYGDGEIKERCRKTTWFHLKKHKGISFYITLETNFMKSKQDGGIETRTAYFCGKNRRMIDMREFQDLYAERILLINGSRKDLDGE